MRQKKLGNILYVMSQSPYKLTEDLDVSIIYVDTNLYDEFVKLNQSLDLTRYNYLLLRKSDPPYWPYVNAKEERDFDFDTLTFNVSSYLDENKTMTLQELSVPEDFDGEIKYYLDGEQLDSSTFVLENASIYTVSAITSNSSIYEDDTNSVYSIIYEKFKRDCTLSFDTSSYNVSSYIDESYNGTLQDVNNVPENVLVKYYLNNNVLNSSTYTISNPGIYKITAAIENDSLYNDTSVSYLVNYTKVKRDAVLSFANATVDVSTFVDQTKTMTLQEVNGLPTGQTANYYLDSSLLSSNSIILSNAGNYVVTAKIENSSYYNDASASYLIVYTKEKRNATLSFANAVVEETVEDVTEYSGNVQTVSGLPTGVTANYYIGNTLLSNGVISINNLEEGENTFTITAKIENDPVYNNAQASYTLSITMEISSFENKYLTFEALDEGTFSFNYSVNQDTSLLSYSLDNGKTWVELPKNTSTATVHQGERIIWKGEIPANNNGIGKFRATPAYNRINLEGNIMSLIYSDDFKGKTTLSSNQFNGLFNRYYNTDSNVHVINASNLILPATTLTTNCYYRLFDKQRLTTAPELPATTLAQDCYKWMFRQCGSLNYIKAACPPNSEANKNDWVNQVAATGTYVISDPNYNINDGIIYSTSCVPVGWVIKDYQGNVINPKIIVSFTNSNNLSNNTPINEQFTIPSYQITTNPAAASSEVVYSYSTDNSTWTTIPQYLDTTTLGTFTYYIKAEISNSATYIDKSQVFTYTYKVKQTITDFEEYTCLNDIENLNSLLDTSVLKFNDCVLDLSESLTNGNNVYVQLRDTVTNQTSDTYNGIRTLSASGTYDFNLRENSKNKKIQDVGNFVANHSGYYQYHFTNTMQIYAIQSNVRKDKVYFKLPYYPPKQNANISFQNSVVNVSTYVGEDYTGTIQSLRNVPSGVTPKYYLDSSLLSSNNITLTTTGNHTVVGAIENDANYNDISTSYTINYTREKKDATLRVNFSPASGQTYQQDEVVTIPTITTNNYPVSVNPTISYSTDGENYSNSLPQYVDTSTAGTYAIYVKQEILNSDSTYKPQSVVSTWEYTVASD